MSLLLPPPPFFTLRRNWCPAERSQDRLLLLLLSAFNHSSEREKTKQNLGGGAQHAETSEVLRISNWCISVIVGENGTERESRGGKLLLSA